MVFLAVGAFTQPLADSGYRPLFGSAVLGVLRASAPSLDDTSELLSRVTRRRETAAARRLAVGFSVRGDAVLNDDPVGDTSLHFPSRLVKLVADRLQRHPNSTVPDRRRQPGGIMRVFPFISSAWQIGPELVIELHPAGSGAIPA